MQDKSNNVYDQRIARVCDYTSQHLDDVLTLEMMSHVAAFSKYHFHRVFQTYTGTSVTKFIQLTRFKRASFRLAFEKDQRLIDIALEAHFDSAEAFSRAFKRTFNQTPSEFRAAPLWAEWHQRYEFCHPPLREHTMNVTITQFNTTPIALLTHLGPPEKVFDTASQFIAWRKATGLSPIKTSRTFGIPHSDPNITEPDKFRWDVCGEFAEQVPANDYGVKSGVIPGGKCAVARHKGSHNTMESSIYHLYKEWLPQSRESLRGLAVIR